VHWGAALGGVGLRRCGPRDQLAPACTTVTAAVPEKCHLDLPGYPGGYDIVGNQVNEQFRLDAVGEALLLFAAAL
jgi:hypothetical protein